MWQVSEELPKLVNQEQIRKIQQFFISWGMLKNGSLQIFQEKHRFNPSYQECEHGFMAHLFREIRRLRGLSPDRSPGRDVSDHHASPFVGTPRRSNRSDRAGKIQLTSKILSINVGLLMITITKRAGAVHDIHPLSMRWSSPELHDIQWPTVGFFRGGPTPNATFPQGSIRTSFLRNSSVDDRKKDPCYVRPDFCGVWGWVALGRYRVALGRHP